MNQQSVAGAREAAHVIWKTMMDFSYLCFLYFWDDVLEVNMAQQYLQTKGLSLDRALVKLEALRFYMLEECNHVVERAIKQALRQSAEYGIAVEGRIRFKKPGEKAKDAGLTL